MHVKFEFLLLLTGNFGLVLEEVYFNSDLLSNGGREYDIRPAMIIRCLDSGIRLVSSLLLWIGYPYHALCICLNFFSIV